MSAIIALLLGAVVQQGPVSNGGDFGSCLTPDRRPLDLREVMLLRNRELITTDAAGRYRLILEEPKVLVRDEAAPEGSFSVIDVRYALEGPEGDPDIFLILGLLDGRPVVYWRETYQHRSFRQGLFAVSPDLTTTHKRVLTPICEGRGGIDSSH